MSLEVISFNSWIPLIQEYSFSQLYKTGVERPSWEGLLTVSSNRKCVFSAVMIASLLSIVPNKDMTFVCGLESKTLTNWNLLINEAKSVGSWDMVYANAECFVFFRSFFREILVSLFDRLVQHREQWEVGR